MVLENPWMVVEPMVDWVEAVMSCLTEVVGNLWVMVGALVEWAAMEAVMGCLIEVVGSLWVMVEWWRPWWDGQP